MKYTGPALALFLSMTACTGLRKSEHKVETPPASPPAEVMDNTQTPPTAEENNTEPAPNTQPATPTTAGQNCTCVEAKPAKPKPKPKPKPVLKESPAQLPTAPVVVETPPGGVVNAQVHEMSVSVMSILGKRVKGPKDEDLGRVVDVLADSSGRVRVAIIDFGGFLGVGNHRIAVDWPLLRFNPDARDPSLLLSLNREKLQAAPEYKDNPRPQTLMEPPSPTPAPATAPASTPEPAATGAPPADNKK